MERKKERKKTKLRSASSNSNFTVDSLSSFSIHKMRLVMPF